MGLLYFGLLVSLALNTSSICSRDPFRPIRKQQRICLFGHQTLRSRVDGASFFVRAWTSNCPLVPSHHRKNRVFNRTSNGCRYPQKLFPDPSHWDGWVMTSTEVTTGSATGSQWKHTVFSSKSCFLFNLISKGTYLHAGHRRRPRDAAPKKQSWVAKANRCEWSFCLWSNEWLARKRKLV